MYEPLVSVVIPAYNEEGYITDCLQSLKSQDYKGGIEIIVVDNNSSDTTATLAEKLGATVIFEKKRGVCAARQAGTEAAKGEIIISTDADTAYSSDWIRRFVEIFAIDPKIVAVGGPCTFYDGPQYGKLFIDTYYKIAAFVYKHFGTVISIAGCNTAFKKSAWRGYNVQLHAAGDEIVFLQDLKKEGKIVFLSENKVFTSGRRVKRGFLYNIFVTLIWYYLFDYFLGRITGRSVLGAYPAVRKI